MLFMAPYSCFRHGGDPIEEEEQTDANKCESSQDGSQSIHVEEGHQAEGSQDAQ